MKSMMRMLVVLLAAILFTGSQFSASGVPPKAQSKTGSAQKSGTPARSGARQRLWTNAVEAVTVKGITFRMVRVDGGSFIMGTDMEKIAYGRDICKSMKPAHRVEVKTFYIGEKEVTQELWEAVMGTNPSHFGGYKHWPVEQVSYEDCLEFIRKLNKLTGLTFTLPTEAEWEFAARGGNKSKGYIYSGGNNIVEVARMNDNSNDKTGMVGMKDPNELGIYDMSGNVKEWTRSLYTGDYNSSSEPLADYYSVRGGAWNTYDFACVPYWRDMAVKSCRIKYIGLRLALTQGIGKSAPVSTSAAPTRKLTRPSETVTAKGVSFKMNRVDGGTFNMGSYASDAKDPEKPVHSETVGTFYMGTTEVTQALWKAVMGTNPSDNQGLNFPIANVSLADIEEFIARLNKITGLKFRLPTEAEWEFAARGGNKSKGYQYSGSNKAEEVAWTSNDSNDSPHNVGTKLPNELGLYDMSGNVTEYTADLYSTDYRSPRNGGELRRDYAVRGGSWVLGPYHCPVYRRSFTNPLGRGYAIGFRLAL